jgi:predicted nucleotidyltransferase
MSPRTAESNGVGWTRYPDPVIETGGGAAPSTHDLTERLRHLLAGAPGVLVAYLYGSHAREQAGPLSDVDVALLLDGDHEERRLELTAAIAHVVAPARADVVVLNDAPSALSYRVLRDGTVLASRDERARVQHWVRTVDRYLDMAPARRLLAAGTRNRLREGRFGRRVPGTG